jgi:N-6 DNA Methylase.
MSIDLTGITNKNEYYTNHYFSTVFEENAGDTISAWNAAARESEEIRTPWSMLRRIATQYYAAHDRYERSSLNLQSLFNIRELTDAYLLALGYPEAVPQTIVVDDTLSVPVYLEMKKSNGAPLLWLVLVASLDDDTGVMESYAFDASGIDEDTIGSAQKGFLGDVVGEELATKILFAQAEPPRFLLLVGMNQIALIDRNKWNEKRYLQFELEEIFSRLENTTLQAMTVLLHKDSLCPDDGKVLLDKLDEQSQRNASGVSQDLKYALRESIELLGNEVLYDMRTRLGRDLEADPVDAGQLTLECLRYMYRMLFVLFIESRPELGYAPIKTQTYYSGYSLESLRDIADSIRDDIDEVGDGYYLHETLAKLYDLIYNGYPKTEEELQQATGSESWHDMFLIPPLKAHIFDPEYTKMITASKLRNRSMLRIIELMSLTKSSGRRNSRRGRISYANLGINQMGAVYEALLSYRGFIAEHDLYEVKRAGDSFNELDVGYFVSENELDQYTEDERVRYESGEKKGKLRMYEKGTFIYRLAGREREKSASYYTPEVLTKCLVKYALKELLEGKTADEILQLTICEPAMGSAAFLNEAINQLAEAYISRKEQETDQTIGYEKRFNELQKVKMYIADRNVYGIDLNSVAVELAEVSLWLNTIYEGGFVPWFGTQLINGNSLIGARRQCYQEASLTTTSKGLHWYENPPERVPLGTERKKRRGNAQIYHFLLGDPGMCSYSDKVIKSLEPDNIKAMVDWNKKFTAPYSMSDLETLRGLSEVIDELWANQIKLRQTVELETQDSLSVFGHSDTAEDSHTTIRQKDLIFSKLYKSEHMKNAGPYARLKFAMDYWCALWFWPIDRAELLPSRSEFFNDLNLILVGTVSTGKGHVSIGYDQLSLFDDEREDLQLIHKINALQMDSENKNEVNLDSLCLLFPRLELVRQISEQNHFMHWELEFADLFDERGGFDLVIGNPPWVKIQWAEQGVLSDHNPIFSVHKLTAAQTTSKREEALRHLEVRQSYFSEYESMSGTQAFLNSYQNYPDLIGQQTNLYKCFLPQAWMYGSATGVSAFIHLDGVFDDPRGDALRIKMYPKLKYHFKFQNEKMLFDIMHTRSYSANVYSNNERKVSFDCIFDLYDPKTIDECYSSSNEGVVPGIKTDQGDWNTKGHPGRIIHVSKRELLLFAKVFDGNDSWESAHLPVLHAKELLKVLEKFENQVRTLSAVRDEIECSEMWHETNNQVDGTIRRDVHFPTSIKEMIFSGPHISTANPYAKTPRRVCDLSSDYDVVDLTDIPSSFLPRTNYSIACSYNDYLSRVSDTSWGTKYISEYRLCTRKMLNQDGERTLNSVILPAGSAHINGIFSMGFRRYLLSFSASAVSIPYDFYMKITKKANMNFSAIKGLPVFEEDALQKEAICRLLMLNCVTSDFAALWQNGYSPEFQSFTWSKDDSRLPNWMFTSLTQEWRPNNVLRSDYMRRQALLEIDVITAMKLGMSLNELKTIYTIQFPVLCKNEDDTWFDSTGRIVFTCSTSIPNVGFDRRIWENSIMAASSGQKFYRTITDDTMQGGPIERTIEYVAPFDCCDREQDYETAWKFFEEKYGKDE